MNISYEDRPNLVAPFDEMQLQTEMARHGFISATVYQPGKIVTIGDRTYRVGTAGNLIRTDKERA